MKDALGRLAWFAVGALTVYWLDSRRAGSSWSPFRVRVPASRQERRRRRAFYHLALADPQGDARLKHSIVQRIEGLVGQPASLQVQVDNGTVRLSGAVPGDQRDRLLEEVRDMPGVQKLVNATTLQTAEATSP